MSWNYFISAIYWKIRTCVARQLGSSWLLLSFSTRLFCTQYKKIDKILRQLGARISPLLKSVLHHCMCVLCVHAIQWIIYVKDTTYKKSFPFYPHSLQLLLPVKKKLNSQKSTEKKVCNNSFNNLCFSLNTWSYSNFLPSIKYISSYCL